METKRLKILVHDYSGHPFQVQMSRELARRGHHVHHVYFSGFQTPRGALVKSSSDPANFEILGLSLSRDFKKSSYIQRRWQEIEYGHRLGTLIRDLSPSVVISANTPLDAQNVALKATRQVENCAFVFWLQDIYGEAIDRLLRKKLPLAGGIIGAHYKSLEGKMLRSSDFVVSISDDFDPALVNYGVHRDRLCTVENWAPLDEIDQKPKDNPWSRANGLHETCNIIYSGTLGYKHNPELLLRLAQACNANILVFSEGEVARALAREAASRQLTNFSVRSWVDFGDLPDVLAAGDILVALIEPDAGIYSVPSKILTYACAGRPVLASIPLSNLGARIIVREKSGLVVAPNDPAAFVAAAQKLVSDRGLRKTMGLNARSFAEQNFNISKLGDRFEEIIAQAQRKQREEGSPNVLLGQFGLNRKSI